MPYPSRGCRMCKQARVKCDETRPACSRCTKKALSCPGYDSSLPPFSSFIDETPYASGAPRKPRKPNRESCGYTLHTWQAHEAKLGSKSPSGSHSSDVQLIRLATRKSLHKIPKALEIKAETQALAYFNYHHLMSTSLSYEKAMWTHLNDCRQQWEGDKPDTMLGLAVSSLALAQLNYTRPSSDLAVMSFQRYNLAIEKIGQALLDTEQVTSDQLLLAVMATSYYEVRKILIHDDSDQVLRWSPIKLMSLTSVLRVLRTTRQIPPHLIHGFAINMERLHYLT